MNDVEEFRLFSAYANARIERPEDRRFDADQS
jgi:hypothetical protein